MCEKSKLCHYCNKKFYKKPSHSKKAWIDVKFCSKNCYTHSQKGIIPVCNLPENRRYITPWNKGNKTFIKKNTDSINKCLNCNLFFKVEPYRKQKVKFCSSLCKTDYSLPQIYIKSCLFCRKLFETKLSSGKFCSRKCSAALISKNTKIKKECLFCSSFFYVGNYYKNQRFCSTVCFNKNKDNGKTYECQRIRTSKEYCEWRKSVFKRDNYTCVLCNQRGGQLNADHIKRFADYPDLRLDINNGRTLCVKCHRQTDTYGNKKQTLVVRAGV